MAKSRVRAKPKNHGKPSGQTHRTELGGAPGLCETSQPHELLPDFAGLEWLAGKVGPRQAAPSLPGTSEGQTSPAAGPVSGVCATVLERPVAESQTQPHAATPILVADAAAIIRLFLAPSPSEVPVPLVTTDALIIAMVSRDCPTVDRIWPSQNQPSGDTSRDLRWCHRRSSFERELDHDPVGNGL